MMSKTFTPFPVLTTERLTLRQPENGDYKQIYVLRTDDSVNKYLNREPCRSMDEARNFIQVVNENIRKNESIYWAITLHHTNALIGTVCLFNFPTTMPGQKSDMNYCLVFIAKG